MILSGRYSRWSVSIIASFHGALFVFIAYLSYRFDRAFHSQWITHNLIQNSSFLLAGVFFLWIAYLLCKQHRRAKIFAALSFSGTLIWLLYDFFSSEPSDWRGLIWLIPSTAGLGMLLMLSTKSSAQPREKFA